MSGRARCILLGGVLCLTVWLPVRADQPFFMSFRDDPQLAGFRVGDISADGRTLVGSRGGTPLYWPVGQELVELPLPSGATSASVSVVSGDGSTMVGIADFGSLALEGAIGGSFSERARGRLAARWEQSDGYVEPGISPFTGEQVAGRDSHGADGYSIRGSLQFECWKPGDNSDSHAPRKQSPFGRSSTSIRTRWG